MTLPVGWPTLIGESSNRLVQDLGDAGVCSQSRAWARQAFAKRFNPARSQIEAN